jgi:hypothetical protein
MAAALLALTVLVPAVAVTAGAPPPRSVCEPCHEDLERGAERSGIGIDVTRSVATMQVHENGSATWTVTSHYVPGAHDGDPDIERRNASALATDPELRRDVVSRAVGGYYDPDADRLRSVEANDSAIRFSFREHDIARETPGGVLIVDAFHTGGHGTGWYVDVTRIRIVGPDGTVIVNGAADAAGDDIATAANGTLTLAGDVEDPPAFDRNDVYVAFAQPGPAAGPLAQAGVAIATLPIALEVFPLVHLPGLAVLLIFLGLARWRRGGEGGPDRRWTVASIGGYLAVTLLVRPPTAAPGMFFFVLTALFVLFGLVIGLANWFAYGRTEATPA